MLEWARSRVLALGRPVHVRLRGQKLKLFEALLDGAAAACTLLDVGGGLGIAGEFARLYSWFGDVTVVNIRPPGIEMPLARCTVRGIVADGCGLPFSARAFDWVFSNAVIEHVGDWERQKSFAKEIRRVARKGYFVATPNRRFPIEPHTYLPFYQFLTPGWQRRVVRFSPGYLREYEEIHLLSARDLKSLFPEARVIESGFPLLGNSLVAHYKEQGNAHRD
jgi:ubiquinone/menaquinone biosynthesis C-methylase UbiE